jgi:hypothetical protein
MGCLLPIFGLTAPRLVIVVLWIFTNYLDRAFETFIWPLLGFFFLPTTTIAYAIAHNSIDSSTVRLGMVVLGVLLDVGLIGSGRGIFKGRRAED